MSSPRGNTVGLWRSRWAAIGAAVAVALGAGGVSISQAVTSSGEKPIYLPIEPCRLADTRPAPDTVGPRTTPIGAEETYTIDGWGSVGNCNLPTATAGLSLNVTAVGATQQTNLRFFPAGAAVPTAANLNPTPGAPPTPNAVNVDLNGSGQFSVFNKFGSVAVVIDVVGIYDDHHHDDRYYTESEVDGLIAALGGDDYENVIVVAKSGGHFASVTSAMDAIGTDPDYPAASSTNRYLVWVAPGVYENEDIDMQPYVDIEGAGQGVTVLRSVGGGNGISPDNATLVGADNAELRDITVENEGADSSVWAFAIYTAGSTRFHRVTANGSGGSRARGMVIGNGGAPVLIDVILRANGAAVSNLGLDLVLATAIADGVFAQASGGQVATGILVNAAASEVQLENVSTAASGATDELYGLRAVDSDVTLEGYRTTVTGSASAAYGVRCDSAGHSLQVLDATVFVDNTGGAARGAFASACHLEVRNAVVDALASSLAVGVQHYQNHPSIDADVTVTDVEARSESSGGTAYGVVLNQSGPSTADTYGRVSDVNTRAIGGNLASNTWGVLHGASGEVQYRGMTIVTDGSANFMYGIQANAGIPRFDDAVIDAVGDASSTVFGVELLADGSTLTNARVKAINTASGTNHDAVGVKANSASDVTFIDVTAYAEAETNVWGADLFNSSVRLSGVDVEAVGNPGTGVRGVQCSNGSADIVDSRMRATVSGVTTIGLYAVGSCVAEVRGSELAAPAQALRTLGTADVLIVNSELNGGASTSGSPTDTQVCVAVTHNSAGEAFTAGPVSDCP